MTTTDPGDDYFPDRIGTLRSGPLQTWYRVDGDLAGDRVPLVVLHGGPGAAHNYCLAMTGLARDGRAVVLYDQVGCGNSTHLPDEDPSFWTVRLFIEELDRLVDALGLRDGFHLLGQSWGGMLAGEYALTRPEGLRSLVLADTLASMRTWRSEAERLIDDLPPDDAQALREGESSGDFTAAGYLAATEEFYRRHVCRVDPMPVEVRYTFAQLEADPTVYHAMNGPSEFTILGSLREWTIEDRLPEIDVPTLVVAGGHDESTPAVWGPLAEQIPGARHHVFADSSHMPHVEQPEEFLDVVGSFLAETDRS